MKKLFVLLSLIVLLPVAVFAGSPIWCTDALVYDPATNTYAPADDGAKIPAEHVGVNKLDTPTYEDLQAIINTYMSSGKFTGGGFTDNGDGSITVAAGTGLIKSTDSDTGALYSFDWAEDTNVTLTDNSVNFIYVDYNSGTPQIGVATSSPTDHNTKVLLGLVYRSGTTLHMTNAGQLIANYPAKTCWKDMEVNGKFQWVSGVKPSETGTRYLKLSEGTIYAGLTKKSISAYDSTSTALTAYYSDGGTGWNTASVQQIDNQYYDNDSGTLASLTADYKTCRYIYIDPDGHVYMVYGTSQYSKLADAIEEEAPTSLPDMLGNIGMLVGKVIVKEGETNFKRVYSYLGQKAPAGTVADHQDLGGIPGASEGYHLSQNDYIELTGWVDDASVARIAIETDHVIPALRNGTIADTVTAIGATECTMVVESAIQLTANLTIPSTLALEIKQGGNLHTDRSIRNADYKWTQSTKAQLIEDCEDAWDELVDADVTSTADTVDYEVGAASAKLVVADAATAEDILATEVITSSDISGYSYIRLWIKSSVATASGDLQLLLDDTAQCASPLETIDIPALTADTWVQVNIPLANHSSDTAIISVGLKYTVDIGACTIHLDDLQSTSPYEYYLELAAGGDPGISEPYICTENGSALTTGTAGFLAANEWDWADNDTLGYSTVYVRLSDDADPDGKAEDYVKAGYKLTINGSFSVGLYQVFSGDGSVSFNEDREVYPEWWGAVSDGVVDDAIAINKALLSSKAVKMLKSSYWIKTTINVPAGTTLSGLGGNVGVTKIIKNADIVAIASFGNLHGFYISAEDIADTTDGIDIINGNRCIFYDIKVHSVGRHGVIIRNGALGSMSNLYVYNAGADGLRLWPTEDGSYIIGWNFGLIDLNANGGVGLNIRPDIDSIGLVTQNYGGLFVIQNSALQGVLIGDEGNHLSLYLESNTGTGLEFITNGDGNTITIIHAEDIIDNGLQNLILKPNLGSPDQPGYIKLPVESLKITSIDSGNLEITQNGDNTFEINMHTASSGGTLNFLQDTDKYSVINGGKKHGLKGWADYYTPTIVNETNYTADWNDRNISVKTGASDITITLNSTTVGQTLKIWKSDNGAGSVLVNPNGRTINGNATNGQTLCANQYDCVVLTFDQDADGTLNWIKK